MTIEQAIDKLKKKITASNLWDLRTYNGDDVPIADVFTPREQRKMKAKVIKLQQQLKELEESKI